MIIPPSYGSNSEESIHHSDADVVGTDIQEMPTDKDQTDTDATEGETMPVTATNTYQFLLLGSLLIILGSDFILYKRIVLK